MTIDTELLEKHFTANETLPNDFTYHRDNITMFSAFGDRDLWYISTRGYDSYYTSEGVNRLLHFLDIL